MQRVLVARLQVHRGQAETLGQFLRERLRLAHAVAVVLRGVCEQRCVVPDRPAVGPPENAEQPARQRLARVPLALSVVEHAAAPEGVAQPPHQHVRALALGRAVGGDRPLRRFHVVDRHEGRFAAHREPHVASLQVCVDLEAERIDACPLVGRVGTGDPRVLVDAGDGVRMLEGDDLAFVGEAGHRRCALRIGGAGERDMALAGEQAGGRVEADPARSWYVDLRPGMQVGEVLGRPARTLERLLVGDQLYQVAGHEACRQAHVAQHLHQHPAGVPAGAECTVEGLFAGLHARLHPDRVGDIARQPLVDRDQEVDGTHARAVDAGQPPAQVRAGLAYLQVWREVLLQVRFVLEREVFCRFLEEEVERVDHRHVRDDVDLHRQFHRALGEHDAAEVVSERVLLPVQEMRLRRDAQRIALDRCARMHRRPQPDHMR